VRITMGIYKVKKAFGHYSVGSIVQLSDGDAEKYKDFIEAVKDNKKATASGGK